MKLKLDLDDFRVPDGKPFRIKKAKTKVKDLYQNDAHYESLIAEFRVEIDELQQKQRAQGLDETDKYEMRMLLQGLAGRG